MCRLSRKLGGPQLAEPSGHVHACTGIALPLLLGILSDLSPDFPSSNLHTHLLVLTHAISHHHKPPDFIIPIIQGEENSYVAYSLQVLPPSQAKIFSSVPYSQTPSVKQNCDRIPLEILADVQPLRNFPTHCCICP
jgi:hypothetical protein